MFAEVLFDELEDGCATAGCDAGVGSGAQATNRTNTRTIVK